jgi:hypothetical protein
MVNIFKKQVSLTYLGEESYGTGLGSILSYIYLLIIIYRALYDYALMRTQPILNITTQTVY